jgi:hypothetical protein
VHQPVRLHDQDKILIGGKQFIFREPEEITPEYQTTLADRTIQEIEKVPCWLLVADIVDFTALSRSLVSERLAALVGGWFATCRKIIEQHDGTINKYLGDGILAYWHKSDATPEGIAATIDALKKAQALEEPRFRFIFHFGLVAIGVASLAEESLMGMEVNFAFRLKSWPPRSVRPKTMPEPSIRGHDARFVCNKPVGAGLCCKRPKNFL